MLNADVARDPNASFLAITGALVVVGKQPDGDSVRFVAADASLLGHLANAQRLRVSRDGSVQLRLEAIDAPELHYGAASQPLGVEARDELLRQAGFSSVRFDPGDPNVVTGAEPLTVPATILARSVEANGRPVAYLLVGEDRARAPSGHTVQVGADLLARTLNHRLLKIGVAYPTLYTSTPGSHRVLLRAVAADARRRAAGVWAHDSTKAFPLVNQDSIGPHGRLVLPKLFRRCTDYLKDVRAGFRGTLPDWLVAHSGGTRDENDRVLLDDRVEVLLSDLVRQRNRTIIFQADLLSITFVEK